MRNRSPHLHSSGSVRRHRLFGQHGQMSSEVAKATALLSRDHELVRLLDLAASLRRQIIVVSLALVGGGLASAFDTTWATALIAAAAAVELVLASTLAVLASRKRSVVRDLFLNGRGDLPVRALDRERARLTKPRTRARLARSLDHLVNTAGKWPRINRNYRPIFDVRVVRAAAPLLTEIATLLRDQPAPQQTLQIERLLTSGNSPLYGHDAHALRQELELLKRQLQRTANDS